MPRLFERYKVQKSRRGILCFSLSPSILLRPPGFSSFSHASPWNHHNSTASPIILGIPWSKHSDASRQPAYKVQNHPCPGFLNAIKFKRVGGEYCVSLSPSIFPQPPSLRKLVIDASNTWRPCEAHAEPTRVAFAGICQFGARPCWGPMLGSCWCILCAKKLGLEGPMLGSCRAFIPCWGYSILVRLEAVRGNFWVLFFALKIISFLARRNWAWKGYVGLM